MAPTDEQAKIIALEAKLGQMYKKPSNPSTSNTGKSNQKKGNTNSSKSSNKKGGKKETPSWMTKWPGRAFVDADQSKVKDGKTYWWCKKHKRFCMHKTSECRKPANTASGGRNQSSNNTSSASTATNNNSTPSIRVSTATMMDE